MMLTADHIRYAQNTQLEELTGYNASTFSEWTHSDSRQMTGNTQERLAHRLGMNKLEFIKAWDLRRADAAIARRFQDELNRMILQAPVGAR